ncbi:hypothetical protein [Defluviitalea raffinosedens]|uniref:hypothetical protein n=1 Tax=Defluviitalea raffinosedens TaxID=1450156 RepID=UPI001958280D|nr:hypothetical protein [Defluviitalea raffinosedens]
MSLMISLVMFFSIPACGDNIKNINVIDVESKIYTEDDIHSAIQIILEEFNKSWNGCTLKEIYYAGDETCQDYQDWADRNGADEAIVLLLDLCQYSRHKNSNFYAVFLKASSSC